MKDNAVIAVEHLWKQYGLPVPNSIKRLRQGLKGGKTSLDHWALKDISFEVKKGETIGVIGLNGAGKSTLLKVLAGVTPVTSGTVEVQGRVFPMIELNAGIHPELTGRENVRLLGAIMGFSRREIENKIPGIESFTELGEWLDRPVRMYSSGMLARLGFGVAINVDADVLLVDEVLGVGDIGFYNKCLRQLEDMYSWGRSFLFVSHNMRQIRRICDKVLFLDAGSSGYFGATETGIELYEETISETGKQTIDKQFDFVGVHLDHAQLKSVENNTIEEVKQGESVCFEFNLSASQEIQQATVNIVVESIEAIPVIWNSYSLAKLQKGNNFFQIRWDNLRLKAGVYTIRVGLSLGLGIKGFRKANVAHLKMAGDSSNPGLYVPRAHFSHMIS
jgi:ABC-type polysaccharide/polyol phosphate transport system ATPase subunit